MAILILTSTGGSPGVTSLAVGLALTWPRPVLLADCDPGAHQAILAGYLAGQTSNGKGLLRVAEAHRDRRPLREVVIDQSLALTEDDGDRRLFLPGFTKPGSAVHFGGVWEDLADTFARLGDVGFDVIVDAGRLGPYGLPSQLLERSALTAVVLRTSLRAVMSARVHLPVLARGRPVHDGRPDQLGLVLVGEGQPYGRAEMTKALERSACWPASGRPGDRRSPVRWAPPAPQVRLRPAGPVPPLRRRHTVRRDAADDRAGRERDMSDSVRLEPESRPAPALQDIPLFTEDLDAVRHPPVRLAGTPSRPSAGAARRPARARGLPPGPGARLGRRPGVDRAGLAPGGRAAPTGIGGRSPRSPNSTTARPDVRWSVTTGC